MDVSPRWRPLKIEGKFLIEKCDDCVGMFFDPGELEAVLDKSVKNVYVVDYQQIGLINKQKRHDDYGVSYIKCPVCRKIMNRVNFGHRSGVVIDRCRDHGVWLDGGELRHLMEWTKAGGQMLHQKVQQRKQVDEAKRRERRQREQKMRDARDRAYGLGDAGHGGFYSSSRTRRSDDDLLGLLSRFFS